jgi:hypothetical protein
MSLERRRFMKSATLTAVSAGLALTMGRVALGQKQKPLDSVIGFQVPIKAQQDPLFYFTEATFRPYLNGFFQAPNSRGKLVTLKLVSVTGYKVNAATRLSTAKARETRSFSLMFQSSQRLPPLTSIHQVSHPALGKFDLFLSPREKDGEFYYEAVFNHL